MSINLFGWVPQHLRTDAERSAHDSMIRGMPKFAIKGRQSYGKKVALFDFSKAANGGKHRDPQFQEDGSCVGQGGGRAIWTLSDVQKVKLGDVIETTMPFFLYTYGVSRWLMNPRAGRGQGSLGSTFAAAARDYGTPHSLLDGLPKPLPESPTRDGICYGKEVERAWSFSTYFDPKWKDLAKPHLVRTVAPVLTADDVRDSVVNGHPVTTASTWGGLPGVCPVVEGVLLNRRAAYWPHQMCILAWWEHDKLGEIFWVQNSWGKRRHGVCPSGAPLGGFWVTKADVEFMVRQRDSFAFSSFLGYPAQNMDLDTFVHLNPREPQNALAV